MNVTDLMTSSLKEHPEQRNFFLPIPAKEWPEFVNGIDLNGIIVPLFVSARDGVTVLDGHQRLTAAKELNVETVPVVMREFETEADEVAFMVTVNDGRRHDSAETRANRADYFLRKFSGESTRLIAAKAGVSNATVHRRKKVLEAAGEIEEHEQVTTKRGTHPRHQTVTPVTVLEGSPQTPEVQAAPDLTPAKFICPECQDVFTEQVWHCPVCVHHWPLEDDECKNCHQVTRLSSGELQVSVFAGNEDDEEPYEYPTELPTDDGPELPTFTPSKTYKEVSDAVATLSQYSEGQLLQLIAEEPDWYPVPLAKRFGYAVELLTQVEIAVKGNTKNEKTPLTQASTNPGDLN